MEAVARKCYTLEEYFAFCEMQEGRFEFINGEIMEMMAESVTASQIIGNIHFYLHRFLEDNPYILSKTRLNYRLKRAKSFVFLIF